MERAGSYLGVLDRIVGIDPTGLAGCEANRRGYNLCSGGEGGGGCEADGGGGPSDGSRYPRRPEAV